MRRRSRCWERWSGRGLGFAAATLRSATDTYRFIPVTFCFATRIDVGTSWHFNRTFKHRTHRVGSIGDSSMLQLPDRYIMRTALLLLFFATGSVSAGQVGPKNCDRGPGIDPGPDCPMNRNHGPGSNIGPDRGPDIGPDPGPDIGPDPGPDPGPDCRPGPGIDPGPKCRDRR